MKLAIGSDHAGVEIKAKIQKKFTDIEFIDMGPDTDESVDYPDYIGKVAKAVQNGEVEGGIAICGTGIGASITANKYRGVRASLCTNEFMAEMTKCHNDSNVLVLGARVTGEEVIFAIVKRWIETPFEGGRHQRRLDKITAIEEEESSK